MWTTNLKGWVSMFLLMMACVTAAGRTIYVDDDATGANNGSSWADAYNYLQDGLADANSSPKPVEVRVGQGVYTPDSNSTDPNGSGDRTATFWLIPGVAIKGGYAGVCEADSNARDIELYETILSGDLSGDDIEISNPEDLWREPSRRENSYCIVTQSERFGPPPGPPPGGPGGTGGEGLNKLAAVSLPAGQSDSVNNLNSVLDGLTITGANAEYSGGGMCNWGGADLTVTNCTFIANSAWERGGGMYNGGMYSGPNGPTATVTNCTFIGNSAKWEGGGGGMYNDRSNPTVTNCTFSDNYSSFWGGGMCNYNYSNPTITDCTFSNNWGYEGGGIYNHGSNPIVSNCTFVANNAGIFNGGSSHPIVTNCTFVGENCGMMNKGNPRVSNCAFRSCRYGMYNYYESNPTVTDCTFSDNSVRGMYNFYKSNPRLINCTFIGNSGGGMCNDGEFEFYPYYRYRGSKPILINCMFSGNSAKSGGGGIKNLSGSEPRLFNCTLYANSTDISLGGGIYDDDRDSCSMLCNCILWGNVADGGTGRYAQIKLGYNMYRPPWQQGHDIEFSCIQGGWPGEGNIDADPCFANAEDGDYHLKSQAGRWDANERRWTKDEVTSPCIDAGDPKSPIGYELFPNGGIINMGAYGGTAEASKSYFGEPVCERVIAGDINGDCMVNFLDFRLMAMHWLQDENH